MKLTIKENDYGLRIYCTKCKKQYNYHNTLCSHLENQRYKSLVSNGDKRNTKMYPTRNYDEALIAAIQFKKDVKNGVVDYHQKTEFLDPSNLSIIDAANIFITFKNNIDVPIHLQKDISTNHLKDIIRNVQQFIDVLRNHNVNPEMTKLNSLADYHVGYWCEHLFNNYSEGSYSTKLKVLQSFITYMIDEQNVKMKNPFKKVNFSPVEYDTSSISKKEFDEVLYAVENKMQYEQLGGIRQEVKNNYRPYLIVGFKLALYTGLRREELVTLSWNDLGYSDKADCLMFVVNNLKVERITGKKFKPKYVPVGPDLHALLQELGYEKFKGSDLRILEPYRGVKTGTMISNLSKGFSHYYKQAFPDVEPKKFKILRKTYLSYLYKSVGDNMIELSSHGSMKIINKHYLDEEVVARALTMRIFE